MNSNNGPAASGPNAWLIEEMFDQFKGDPDSVPEEWRAEFEGQPAPGSNGDGAAQPQAAPAAPPQPAPPIPAPTPVATPAPVAAPAQPVATATPQAAAPAAAPPAGSPELAEPEPGEPLRGVAARIVTNMEASLQVPTATSFREIPAKLLEVNRKVLNNHLKRVRGGKVSFTHLIGYAVVRAISGEVPNMNNTFAADSDGKPRLIRNPHVNLGIAVDQLKADGSRALLVPVLREADTLDFAELRRGLRRTDQQGPGQQAHDR